MICIFSDACVTEAYGGIENIRDGIEELMLIPYVIRFIFIINLKLFLCKDLINMKNEQRLHIN